MKTVQLLRGTFTPEDVLLVMQEAAEECACTDEMKRKYQDDPEPLTCVPCACRFALNCLSTVVDVVKPEIN